MTDKRAVVHAEGAAGRWAGLTLMEQMAHIGSEVERTIRAHERGREARFERVLQRALELFDLTAADPRWRGPRRREILRAREEFCRLFFADDVPPHLRTGLQSYFLHFAVAARSSQRASVAEGQVG